MSRSSAAAAEAKSLGVKRQKRKKNNGVKSEEKGRIRETLIWSLPVLERRGRKMVIYDSG
jgi:hypothetical protein